MPDGATIADYLSKVSSGDILSLASNGSYTLDADENGFAAILSGSAARHTIIKGNNAIVTGGILGLLLRYKSYVTVENLTLVDQVINGVNIDRSSDISLSNINVSGDQFGAYSDLIRIQNSDRISLNGGTGGPYTTSYGASDGVEFWGPCVDCTVDNYTVKDVTGPGTHNAFEIYGDAVDQICDNIVFTNCHAENMVNGFSCEGGPNSIAHTDIKAINCTATNMADYDAQGTDGATIFVTAGTLTKRNGSVTEL